MKETNIVKETMMEASRLGLVVFRNNTGMLKNDRGQIVQYGLCKGSSDLIGFIRATGHFVAIECKVGNAKPSPEQQLFLDNVAKSGGFSCVINDAKKLKTHLDEYNRIKYIDYTTAKKGE